MISDKKLGFSFKAERYITEKKHNLQALVEGIGIFRKIN